jgi:probable addiction module antidote protein
VDYLNATLADDSPGAEGRFLLALRFIAKARGIAITQLASDAQLGRQALYRSLSESGNPGLLTLMAILREMGLRLSVNDACHEASEGEKEPV